MYTIILLLITILIHCPLLNAIPEKLCFSLAPDDSSVTDASLLSSESLEDQQRVILFENNLLSDVNVAIAYKYSDDPILVDLEKADDPLTPVLKHLRIFNYTLIEKITLTSTLSNGKKETCQLILEGPQLLRSFENTHQHLLIRIQWIAQGEIILPFVLVNTVNSWLGGAMKHLDTLKP